jgi:hypothetical protein
MLLFEYMADERKFVLHCINFNNLIFYMSYLYSMINLKVCYILCMQMFSNPLVTVHKILFIVLPCTIIHLMCGTRFQLCSEVPTEQIMLKNYSLQCIELTDSPETKLTVLLFTYIHSILKILHTTKFTIPTQISQNTNLEYVHNFVC